LTPNLKRSFNFIVFLLFLLRNIMFKLLRTLLLGPIQYTFGGHKPSVGDEYLKVLPSYPRHSWKRYRLETITPDASGILMASMIEVTSTATRRPIAYEMLYSVNEWQLASRESGVE
jgi:hypothetical protein